MTLLIISSFIAPVLLLAYCVYLHNRATALEAKIKHLEALNSIYSKHVSLLDKQMDIVVRGFNEIADVFNNKS